MVVEENKKQKENIENNSAKKTEKVKINRTEKNSSVSNKNSTKKNNTKKTNNNSSNTIKNNANNSNLKNSSKKQNNTSKNKHNKNNNTTKNNYSNKNNNNKQKNNQKNTINKDIQKEIASENSKNSTNMKITNKNENLETNFKKNIDTNTKQNSIEAINKELDSALEKRDIDKEKASIQKEIQESKKEEKKSENKQQFEPINEQKKSKKKPIFKIVIISILILFIILIGAFSIFTYTNNNPSTMAKGIYINGIDVSQMTKDEAKSKVEEYFTKKLSHDITLTHGDFETYINTNEISLTYDINSTINNAFKIGKHGNIFEDNFEILNTMLNGINIDAKYTYSKDTLKTILDNFSKELPDHVVENSYYIEDNNLIITLGSAGKIIDTEKTMPLIENTFSDLSFTDKNISINTLTKEPEKIDISKIHSEIRKDAKDAYYTTNPYVVYPSENGVDFKISEEEAQKLINNATENEITIPLKSLYPSVTTNMIGSEAFPDLLGTFSTKYVSNKDRTTNLSLAAKKINGTVLLPGETFSYNKVVGERTIAAGYKSAAVYENGQVVQGLGGGICQISTTLFNAALFANLEIVELHNHQFVPSYVTAGRDATVVYGTKDFKFKNSRKYAIKIECSVSNGIAKFNIWGVKEPNEYDVSVYAQVTSKTDSYIKSATYRTLKQNGQVVKSEKIANYTYKVH